MGKRLSLVKGESLCFFLYGLKPIFRLTETDILGWLKPIF